MTDVTVSHSWFGELTTMPPEAYEGQLLCPCCGSDENGVRFAICAETDPTTGERYTHNRACNIGRRYAALCQRCEQAGPVDG